MLIGKSRINSQKHLQTQEKEKMCTYLNGKLFAYTGTPIPVTVTDPVPQQLIVFSGEREPIRFDDHVNDYKGSRDLCSKYNRGRKAHNHIKHIRTTKTALKRQTV